MNHLSRIKFRGCFTVESSKASLEKGEVSQDALTLIRLLEMGEHEVAAGKFKSIDEVVARLKFV